jgi:hypothetical protein
MGVKYPNIIKVYTSDALTLSHMVTFDLIFKGIASELLILESQCKDDTVITFRMKWGETVEPPVL